MLRPKLKAVSRQVDQGVSRLFLNDLNLGSDNRA